MIRIFCVNEPSPLHHLLATNRVWWRAGNSLAFIASNIPRSINLPLSSRLTSSHTTENCKFGFMSICSPLNFYGLLVLYRFPSREGYFGKKKFRLARNEKIQPVNKPPKQRPAKATPQKLRQTGIAKNFTALHALYLCLCPPCRRDKQ